MKDILFLLTTSLIIYIVSRIILKEPILFWKKSKVQQPVVKNGKSKKQGKKKGVVNPLEEIESAPFRELFSHVQGIENHMIRHHNNTFTMIAEVEPVNYFLLDQEEQEGIDSIFETWLAQLNYSIRIYKQNRFVDLTKPIKEIQSVLDNEQQNNPNGLLFGQNMIENLIRWQKEQPRYETKTFVIFDYIVDVKDLKADDAEELEEKIVDKAFAELNRRVNTAKSQLRKADMNVEMLATDGIGEVLYYGFNRRKAKKNHYRDIEEQEQLALYSTAEQTKSRIIKVKGEMENVQKESQQEEKSEQPAI